MFHKQILRNDHYLLESFEKKYIKPLAKYIPLWIETYHLTWMSLLWSIGVIISGYYIRNSLVWLWGISFFVLLQYVTDVLDGEVGRRRSTGLVRWGFYMDHFLDFIFLSSLFYGYFIALKDIQELIVITYILVVAFMMHVILTFPITEQFNFSFFGIGISEIRLVIFLINTFIIINAGHINAEYAALIPIILGIALCHTVYIVQKDIWKRDMNSRKKR